MKSFWIQKIKVQLIICLLGHGVEFFFYNWYCRRMEKIIWTDRVRNKVVHGVKEERNILVQ